MGKKSLLVLALLCCVPLGCKSEKQKCIETTEETHKRQTAACQDDACKQQANKTRDDFLAVCNAK